MKKKQKKRDEMKCYKGSTSSLLLLGSFLSGLCHLSSLLSLVDGFDDADGDGLPHVTDGETTKRGVLVVRLNTHRLAWDKLDDASITRFDKLGVVLD